METNTFQITAVRQSALSPISSDVFLNITLFPVTYSKLMHAVTNPPPNSPYIFIVSVSDKCIMR